MKKNNGKKIAVLLLALMLLVGGAIGGTLAWLIAQSNTVVNTFSVGNITISLTETGTDDAGKNSSFKIVPGTTESKDPVVTIAGGSEDCWVFVQVTESNNIARAADSTASPAVEELKYVQWEIDNTVWTAVPGTANVYYTKYTLQADDKELNVLKGETVSYSNQLTKAMMDAVNTQPQLSFQAYAIQSENLTKDGNAVNSAADAWAMIQAQTP